MRTSLLPVVSMAFLSCACAGQENQAKGANEAEAGNVTSHSGGLHGYIGFSATHPPARSEYGAGMGFYSAVWPLVDRPLADFQIGLAGSWITPDNSDNRDRPLAPEGTLARRWPERGPTWSSVFQTVEVFDGEAWGLEWSPSDISPQGLFPQYFKHVGAECVAVAAADVPAQTHLLAQEFKQAGRGSPYTSPASGAWSRPGPKSGPLTVKLADGSLVTYSWYRFVDQPSFQQYHWGAEKKAALQVLVEKIHANWPIDRDYMAPPGRGALATLDPALLVTPPRGLEAGYVPIVTRQASRGM